MKHGNDVLQASSPIPTGIAIALAILGALSILLIGTVANQPQFLSGTLHDKASGFMLNYDQYGTLGNALLKGNVSIDLEVSPTLASMENPYDADRRYTLLANTDEYYYFDHCFYEGKYYCYFGVAPAMFFFVPYQAITGQMLSTPYAVIVMSGFFAALIPVLINLLFKRFVPNAPQTIAIISCFVIFFASNVILIVYFPCFYSVPAAGSLIFTEVALIFWLLVEKLETKREYGFLALGTFFMALNLASRPQLFIGFLFAIPLFWDLFIKGRRTRKLAILAAIVLPLALVAIPLGYYNAIRFGSPFDFGADYNLTWYDIQNYRGDILLYPLLFFYYLFDPPVPMTEFPYLRSAFEPTFGLNTIEEPIIAGFFCLLPISFILFTLPKKWKHIESGTLKQILLISIVGTLIVILFDVHKVGILFRYFADFGWLLGIATALVIGIHAYELKVSNNKPKMQKLLIVCIICLVIAGTLWFFGLLSPKISFHQTNMAGTNPELYEWLRELFTLS